jgi:DNA invertase Pin-like site-specific DNA recombinase
MARSDGAPKRCAIYTRKSSEEGLEQNFNSLNAQRQACEAFVKSQAGEGWHLVKTGYDDGGFSGATMERPALKALLAHIKEKRIHVVVVYKVDRLTRSLVDFARMVELFDAHNVSFVAVTQQFIYGPLPSARPARVCTAMIRLHSYIRPLVLGILETAQWALMEIRAPSPQSTPRPRWA